MSGRKYSGDVPNDEQFEEALKELEARHPGNAMCEQALAESWEPNITTAKWISEAEKRL